MSKHQRLWLECDVCGQVSQDELDSVSMRHWARLNGWKHQAADPRKTKFLDLCKDCAEHAAAGKPRIKD